MDVNPAKSAIIQLVTPLKKILENLKAIKPTKADDAMAKIEAKMLK
jgi:hypothetical protein